MQVDLYTLYANTGPFCVKEVKHPQSLVSVGISEQMSISIPGKPAAVSQPSLCIIMTWDTYFSAVSFFPSPF